jgi:hypothetical protein
LRLIDMNVEPLDDEVLAWADVVMLSGMRIQRASFRKVVARAHALGKRVVAGGPYVTTDPDDVRDDGSASAGCSTSITEKRHQCTSIGH